MVPQLEVERQNQELRGAQTTLEASLAHYYEARITRDASRRDGLLKDSIVMKVRILSLLTLGLRALTLSTMVSASTIIDTGAPSHGSISISNYSYDSLNGFLGVYNYKSGTFNVYHQFGFDVDTGTPSHGSISISDYLYNSLNGFAGAYTYEIGAFNVYHY